MKKNILMVSDDFLPAATGAGIHLQIVAKELAAKGHHVVVLTTRQGSQSEKETWNGVTVYRARSLRIAGFYQALPSKDLIREILIRHQIEIVHHHYLSHMLKRVFTLANRLNISQVYTYHMAPQHITQPWFMKPFRKMIEKMVSKQCNQFSTVMSPSTKLAEEIKKSGVQTKIEVISNPIPFKELNIPKNEKRDSTLHLFFAGRLAIEKNIPLLLKAVQNLVKAGIAVDLKIAGDGPLKSELLAMVNDLKINNQVSFLGHLNQEEIKTQYSQCDIFVLPSFLETQGMVAMEAMRFSKPVIVTKEIVSAQELVTDGWNGYIVDAWNSEELTERLKELNNNSQLCEQMGRAGYQKSLSYAPEMIVSKIEDVYFQVLNEKIKESVFNNPIFTIEL